MDIQDLARAALTGLQELESSAENTENQIAEVRGLANQGVTLLEGKFMQAMAEATELKSLLMRMRTNYATEREQALVELRQLEAAVHQFRDDAIRDLSEVEAGLEQTETKVAGLLETLDTLEEELDEHTGALDADLKEKHVKALEIAAEYTSRFSELNDAAEAGHADITEKGNRLKSNSEYQRDEVFPAFQIKLDPVEQQAPDFDYMLDMDGLTRENDSTRIIANAGEQLRDKVAHVKETAANLRQEMEERLQTISSRGETLTTAADVATVSIEDLQSHWGMGIMIFRSATEMLKQVAK